jgi:hypothetical protein
MAGQEWRSVSKERIFRQPLCSWEYAGIWPVVATGVPEAMTLDGSAAKFLALDYQS